MNENKFSTYSVIPTEVMLSKNISSTSKILYGLISSLCNERGYCWASNEYLGELIGVTGTRASLIIKELIEEELIESEVEKNYKRKITLRGALTKVKGGYKEKLKGALTKVKDNNINEYNNILEPSARVEEKIEEIVYEDVDGNGEVRKKKEKMTDPAHKERMEVIGYFIRRSNEIHHFCPQIQIIPALKLIKEIMKYKNLEGSPNTSNDLRDLVDWFLEESDMYSVLGSDIKICFSNAAYNKYIDYKRKKYG